MYPEFSVGGRISGGIRAGDPMTTVRSPMATVELGTQIESGRPLTWPRRLLIELGGTPASRLEAGWRRCLSRLLTMVRPVSWSWEKHEGRFVAVCTVSFVDALRTAGRYAIIQEMYVDPGVRSSGVGIEVLWFALDHAISRGCAMVELGTPFHGDRQIQFYQRAGFHQRWRAPPVASVAAERVQPYPRPALPGGGPGTGGAAYPGRSAPCP